MTRVRTALVVGGGIAGPATALALHKAGIEATVFEAHPTGAEGIGAFLTLGSNGVAALRVLDAADPVLELGFPTPGITLRNAAGRRIGESVISVTLPDGTTSVTLKRPDLYRAMHEEAVRRGVPVRHGKRLVAARESAQGVRATFADGTTATGDVLVGADGIRSTVRRIVDPGAPAPRYAGLISTGGYATGVRVDAPPGGYKMIFGRRAFFGYALAPDGEVWWFANLPRRPEPARGEVEAVDTEAWRARLTQLFRDDAGPILPIVAATPELMTMLPIHSVPRLPTWRRGRIVVLGDAAHAPSPSSGQGASLSIEDGVVLAQCLRDVADPAEALARFEAARRPRVERIVRAAARVNDSKAAGPVGRVVRDAVLPAVLRMAATSRATRETYGFQIDWDAPARLA
jgi:2-polyprenyl-6-methoxyphenol hydroxylase-like FAD-dependent oxidoreductase